MKRRQGRPMKPIAHGEPRGYQQHFRHRVPIDDADSCGCRAANRKATYERMERAKARREAA